MAGTQWPRTALHVSPTLILFNMIYETTTVSNCTIHSVIRLRALSVNHIVTIIEQNTEEV